VKTTYIWVFAGAIFLVGCGSQAGSWNQYYQLIRESLRNSTGSRSITIEQAAGIPYASLAYRVDGGNEMLLVLATDTNGDQLWTAASHVVLLTRDGRIMRSVGLPHDKGGTTSRRGDPPPAPGQALQGNFRSTRILDFPDKGLHGVVLNCVAMARRRELVSILGTRLLTTRIDEACQSQNPRWHFTDSYWVDAEGFVWTTFQHLHPAGTTIQLKILRPPE
jgi:hypothetical protein